MLLLIFGTLWWLSSYTRHGESVKVPNLRGLSLQSLDDAIGAAHLSYLVTDSIYSDEFPRGTVIQQNPTPGQKVKDGRTIYLTVNSILPEMVIMPDLYGKSKRIAIPLIEISGLQLERIQYRPDESCTDCVIDQLYQGKSIKQGSQIRKGEPITLVLGQRSNELTNVPRLLGLRYTDAYELLMAYSLNMGAVLSCQGCASAQDSAGAFVVNQRPGPHQAASLGSFVDIYLTTDSTKISDFTIPADTSAYEDPFTDNPFD